MPVFQQLFVKDNQDGEETSVINYLCFIGSPLDTTNMNEFKRVSGMFVLVNFNK